MDVPQVRSAAQPAPARPAVPQLTQDDIATEDDESQPLSPPQRTQPTVMVLHGLTGCFHHQSYHDCLFSYAVSGSGKSTFCHHLTQLDPTYCRVNQDVLKTRKACLSAARQALAQGFNVVIDRTNLTPQQRQHWVELGRQFGAKLIAVDLITPKQTCMQRAARRMNHEGGVEGEKAKGVIARQAGDPDRCRPTVSEGFVDVYKAASTPSCVKAVLAGRHLTKAELQRVQGQRAITAYFSQGSQNSQRTTPSTSARTSPSTRQPPALASQSSRPAWKTPPPVWQAPTSQVASSSPDSFPTLNGSFPRTHSPKRQAGHEQTSPRSRTVGNIAQAMASTKRDGARLSAPTTDKDAIIGEELNSPRLSPKACLTVTSPTTMAALAPNTPSHRYEMDVQLSQDVEDTLGGWNCATCTFFNVKPLALVCEMCGTPRNADKSARADGGKDHPATQDAMEDSPDKHETNDKSEAADDPSMSQHQFSIDAPVFRPSFAAEQPRPSVQFNGLYPPKQSRPESQQASHHTSQQPSQQAYHGGDSSPPPPGMQSHYNSQAYGTPLQPEQQYSPLPYPPAQQALSYQDAFDWNDPGHCPFCFHRERHAKADCPVLTAYMAQQASHEASGCDGSADTTRQHGTTMTDVTTKMDRLSYADNDNAIHKGTKPDKRRDVRNSSANDGGQLSQGVPMTTGNSTSTDAAPVDVCVALIPDPKDPVAKALLKAHRQVQASFPNLATTLHCQLTEAFPLPACQQQAAITAISASLAESCKHAIVASVRQWLITSNLISLVMDVSQSRAIARDVQRTLSTLEVTKIAGQEAVAVATKRVDTMVLALSFDEEDKDEIAQAYRKALPAHLPFKINMAAALLRLADEPTVIQVLR
eukprot:TRINITY_DN12499_c1_g1_i3.p1 TRINITY_DN12499_c1_g1~~TRINITY_DN12499_c1_g1_i3.p1  ORF type:complete len:923 (+),score=165.18 TRINITY_DN12499_c1_g1_i3:162-2771(+)